MRIARVYHGSVVDGPGRRSVVQFQGCPIRCAGCYVPETHSLTGGMSVPIDSVVYDLLSANAEPRDGITVLGGEPFAQVNALLDVLNAVKAKGVHTTVYSGYTLEALASPKRPEVRAALELIDLLIDGPYVEALADGAGEWRGSRNQRLIECPGRALAAGEAR
ncbi:MAG: radical SAM protein [Chloroflexota bacterium]|nr:radical SAM protein [Chloroflexota bacterium]